MEIPRIEMISVRTNVQGTIGIKMQSADGETKRFKVNGKVQHARRARKMTVLERERRIQQGPRVCFSKQTGKPKGYDIMKYGNRKKREKKREKK